MLVHKASGKLYRVVRGNGECLWLQDESGKVVVVKKKWLKEYFEEVQNEDGSREIQR